jgi:hypothetical protein
LTRARAARLRRRALDEILDVGERVLRLAAADLDEVLDEILGVLARHPAARDRVVDGLLQMLGGDHDPLREQVAQRRDRRQQLVLTTLRLACLLRARRAGVGLLCTRRLLGRRPLAA